MKIKKIFLFLIGCIVLSLISLELIYLNFQEKIPYKNIFNITTPILLLITGVWLITEKNKKIIIFFLKIIGVLFICVSLMILINKFFKTYDI